MKTFAYVRNLDEGVPWVAEYPSRRDLEISEEDLSGSYPVIYQHSFEPEDEDYPALAEGEVLLWHSIYGLIIIQSIDLNYYESLLDKSLLSG
jgi:hypothetical protein